MPKKIPTSKILLAFLSCVITLLVWTQGLKDSLNRPSVSFDITQKENEIIELARPAIPLEFQDLFISKSPLLEIKDSLSRFPFSELTERNKLIWLLINSEKTSIEIQYFDQFDNKEYKRASDYLKRNYLNKQYIPDYELFQNLRNDKFLYYLFNKKFNFDSSSLIQLETANIMLIKLILIRLIPLITILIGSILLIQAFWRFLNLKKIYWQEYSPLELNWIDMILLISGGFVVLGEVISPIISITFVQLFSEKLPTEILQSLQIFFGYIFMALPPLIIIYYQIKSIDKEFNWMKDYFQFNFRPFNESFLKGFKGWIMVIPIVLLTSLIMNLLVDDQPGSNPLLEIVLNNNNYFAFLLLFLTTTILAPLFEEIIFRGVLLPILSRDFGRSLGIIISSFVFALAHLSLSEFPPLFVLGVGLAFTRLVSGRLSSSIVMHSLWNGLTFFNLFLLRT